MKRLLLALLLVGALGAAPITLISGFVNARVENPVPAGVTYPVGPAGGGGIDGGALSFTVPGPGGTLYISVLDCCLVGDVYEVLLDGASLGWTAEVPINGPTVSSRTWTVPTMPGLRSLDIWDITLSYIGAPSPFGGGEVPEWFSPAGLSYEVKYAPIPEPGTWVLALAGLAGVGLLRRRIRLG